LSITKGETHDFLLLALS